jgi:uncharacterized membrane protein
VPITTHRAALDQSGVSLRRVLISSAAGVIGAALALLAGASWSVAVLAASDLAIVVFAAWVWADVLGFDAERTARHALALDDSRSAAELVLLAAATPSLVAVAFTLGQAGHSGAPTRGLLTALALVSVALSWISVHTVFALRYARAYYRAPVGGIDFGDEELPDYRDFAYLALTIGMTFAVSDTALGNRELRRTATRHALLSYVFGTGIVAISVSSAAALLQS